MRVRPDQDARSLSLRELWPGEYGEWEVTRGTHARTHTQGPITGVIAATVMASCRVRSTGRRHLL